MLNLILIALPNIEDENKFTEIYNMYCNYVFGIVSKFFDKNMDREDAVYSSLFKIALNISKIDNIDSAETKTFIAITTRNTCITMINKINKIKEFPVENLDYVANDSNSFETIENDERFLTNYCNCLEKLTEKQYEILYLRYANELSLKEIAKILSIKENTAKQRLFSAKQKFRDLIMEDINYEQ